jgi:mannose-6-phosphate isomerase-like protein (cupin superfamily)
MFVENFKRLAKENTNFRKVLQTGAHSQIVAMSLRVGEDIGVETHPETDQIFFIVHGEGEVMIANQRRVFDKKTLIFVPAGSEHNVTNTGEDELKLITIYAPAHHPDGTVQATKPSES